MAKEKRIKPQEKGLTFRQEQFVYHYMASGNAEDAAIKAGYTKDTARANAWTLLKKDHIAALIAEKRKELWKEEIATVFEVQKFWTQTLRNENNELKDRIKASELLARSQGAFIEKIEHSGQIDIVVDIDIVGDFDEDWDEE